LLSKGSEVLERERERIAFELESEKRRTKIVAVGESGERILKAEEKNELLYENY
jgi:hypothetical protein